VSDTAVTVQSLHVYPVKSCAGIELREALLIETGFEFDRTWMLVDAAGDFVSQRELPRLALVRPTLKLHEMVLRAPGMLALHVALDTVEGRAAVRVWGEPVQAYDMGALAARWFSDFLGREVRLVRFDPEQRRLSERRWTGAVEAENAFQDGFPLLVVSSASLAELNRRLAAADVAPVTMARFRPNIVLDGLGAHGEDALDEIAFASAAGPVRLRLVKPCARCPIPDVDPETGLAGHAVGDALAHYRADPRRDGKVTFGMNGVVLEGFERALQVGMHGSASIAFD
jgi:uncharacterized protein YcbX